MDNLVLGRLLPEDLIEVAVSALAEGYDSPSLRVLAGLHLSEADEARKLLDRALDELDIRMPGEREAAFRLAREIARDILSGEIGEFEGANRIWDLSVEVGHVVEFDEFAYAAMEWERNPQMFRQAIIAAAEKFLAGPHPLQEPEHDPPPGGRGSWIRATIERIVGWWKRRRAGG